MCRLTAQDKERRVAFEPLKALAGAADVPCSVQLMEAGAPLREFSSLEAAVGFARDNGAGWKDVEITVHMPREDIVYATGKTRMLIEALRLQDKG